MDAIAQFKTTHIPDIIGPTYEIFAALLEKNRALIESTPKKTFSFYTVESDKEDEYKKERCKLDVYYPSTEREGKPPILLWNYGGGLFTGDRSPPDLNGLCYANVGSFYARQGILTVISDYRLATAGAKNPDASIDVKEALLWIVNNLADVGDVNRIYIAGHSAGAMLQVSLLLLPDIFPDDIRSRIKAVISDGNPYHFSPKASQPSMPREILDIYYGPPEEAHKLSPFGLLEAADTSLVAKLPPLLIVTGTNEPDDFYEIRDDFVRVLKEKNAPEVTLLEKKGHNHISGILTLSAGEGEDWGFFAADWLKKH